jgi:hypothetical protein
MLDSTLSRTRKRTKAAKTNYDHVAVRRYRLPRPPTNTMRRVALGTELQDKPAVFPALFPSKFSCPWGKDELRFI